MAKNPLPTPKPPPKPEPEPQPEPEEDERPTAARAYVLPADTGYLEGTLRDTGNGGL